MTTRRPGMGTSRQVIVELQEQVARLAALVEAQRRASDEQLAAQQAEIATQKAQLAAQQAEIAGLRHVQETVASQSTTPKAQRISAARRGRSDATQVRASSRRALLKGAGVAAAAAATVALVASEGQIAHAAPAADGNPLLIGEINQAATITSLELPDGESINVAFYVDAGTSAISGTIGVSGVSGGTSGVGVEGFGGNGIGVVGYGPIGVQGNSAGTGPGVQGINTSSGIGVEGHSNVNVDFAATGTGRIYQNHQGVAGAPTGSGTSYSIGEQIRDSNGDLWLCIASGTRGKWVMAAHAVYGYSGGATTYIAHPIRLLDTRGNDTLAQNDNGGNPIASGSPYTLTIANVDWQSVQVPANAVGAIGNVTVVADKGSGGYVAVVPSGAGFTGTANLAYSAGQVVSNSFNVGLAGGKLDIIIGSGSADVIVDLFAVVA